MNDGSLMRHAAQKTVGIARWQWALCTFGRCRHGTHTHIALAACRATMTRMDRN